MLTKRFKNNARRKLKILGESLVGLDNVKAVKINIKSTLKKALSFLFDSSPHRFHLTVCSCNVKTGPMPVVTSSKSTCPPTCSIMDECYASFGKLSIWWDKISNGKAGTTLWGLCEGLSKLPLQSRVRLFQAGDIPHTDGQIDVKALEAIEDGLQASLSTAWGYTHHKLTKRNVAILKKINSVERIVIRASCESLEQADKVIALGLPTVVVIPLGVPFPKKTPAGHRVIWCMAQKKKGFTCSSCTLCENVNPSNVIAFLAHGSNKEKLSRKLLKAKRSKK